MKTQLVGFSIKKDLTDYKNCSDTNGENGYFVEFDNDNRTISDTDRTKHNFTSSRDSRYTKVVWNTIVDS